MRCKDDDFVTETLQAHSSVDDQTLCATDAEVRMKEDNRLRVSSHYCKDDNGRVLVLRCSIMDVPSLPGSRRYLLGDIIVDRRLDFPRFN